MAKHNKTPIAVAEGDGIGPEIMAATLQILDAAGAQLEIHPIEVGEKVYLRGCLSGIEPQMWEILRQTKAFLKAPITTPQGGGFKSINVTIRTALGLYANVRPCVSYAPFVETKHPTMDVVIVRENEEDLYTGIEYKQSSDVVHALKVITRPGCERIVRYAFRYAEENGRKKVTCFTKDNILKLTDGLFHQVFDEIGAEFPKIEKEHWIVDIGAAKLADTPQAFDVLVLPNLYGDILSDVAAQIAGSVGLAGSANIGLEGAMFEAIHGSAPRRAGQNMANPSGLLLAAVQMLVHIGQPEVATRIHNGWLTTIEEGIHTYDIFKPNTSRQKVGTREFAQAVIQRLGQRPHTLKEVHYTKASKCHDKQSHTSKGAGEKRLMGIDVYVEAKGSVEQLLPRLQAHTTPAFQLTLIANRGAEVWPHTAPETLCVDQWRCRFLAKGSIDQASVVHLLQQLTQGCVAFLQTQQLYAFGDRPAYS